MLNRLMGLRSAGSAFLSIPLPPRCWPSSLRFPLFSSSSSFPRVADRVSRRALKARGVIFPSGVLFSCLVLSSGVLALLSGLRVPPSGVHTSLSGVWASLPGVPGVKLSSPPSSWIDLCLCLAVRLLEGLLGGHVEERGERRRRE